MSPANANNSQRVRTFISSIQNIREIQSKSEDPQSPKTAIHPGDRGSEWSLNQVLRFCKAHRPPVMVPSPPAANPGRPPIISAPGLAEIHWPIAPPERGPTPEHVGRRLWAALPSHRGGVESPAQAALTSASRHRQAGKCSINCANGGAPVGHPPVGG